MINRLRKNWLYVLGFTAVMALLHGTAGLWLDGDPGRGLFPGAVMGFVIAVLQVLFVLPWHQRLRQDREKQQEAYEHARRTVAQERENRAEAAARSYEQQHGRRPW